MPQINKDELATAIRSYIIHSRYIILNSPNPQYRNVCTLTHLDMCEAHSKMLKDTSCISLKEICQFTLILRRHLEGILPSVNNKSFESSRDKLDDIVRDCKSYLASINTND